VTDGVRDDLARRAADVIRVLLAFHRDRPSIESVASKHRCQMEGGNSLRTLSQAGAPLDARTSPAPLSVPYPAHETLNRGARASET
jgi:hypothetical protein